MKKSVFLETLKKVDEIEKFSTLEDFVICSTFGEEKHRLILEEDFASFNPQYLQVCEELRSLELADFVDFKNGGFDGKFD